MICKRIMEDFVIVSHFEDLDTESKQLAGKAQAAAMRAYAPYSKFKVGTALLLEGDIVVTGTNQENAAFPSGMCAERVALFTASSLHPEKAILKLVTVAMHADAEELAPAPACGGCRQVMVESEFRQEFPFKIVMQNHNHQWVIAESAASLLPFAFTKENLEHGGKK